MRRVAFGSVPLAAFLLLPSSGKADPDLETAFIAVAGERAPAIRNVQHKFMDDHRPGIVVQVTPVTLQAAPDMLIPLDRHRWALIIREIDKNAGATGPGSYSVAYLHEESGVWTAEHVWWELSFVGAAGEPGDDGEEVRHFRKRPFFFSTQKWCGDGECSGSIDAIALNADGPVALPSILGGAAYPSGAGDRAFLDSCQRYAITASIGAPSTRAGLFSVTYRGWTAPMHRRQPKSWFRTRVDYVHEQKDDGMFRQIGKLECDR
ncbi:MAG: hypothetical protein ACRYG8_01635 [Janthinobacterium lividum]